jgi:hypothetical protein
VECKACGLTLVSAPHLARSYHHLFPLPAFKEVIFSCCACAFVDIHKSQLLRVRFCLQIYICSASAALIATFLLLFYPREHAMLAQVAHRVVVCHVKLSLVNSLITLTVSVPEIWELHYHKNLRSGPNFFHSLLSLKKHHRQKKKKNCSTKFCARAPSNFIVVKYSKGSRAGFSLR